MRRSALIALVLVGALLGACRSTTAAQTIPTSQPTTTTTVPLAAAPPTTMAATPTTGEPAAPSFPVTVDTDLGAVTLAGQPSRIVSLSATHTEMLYAVGAGDQVVGTDLTSNFPPEAETTAKVDAFSFSVEEVVALEPDLVILAFDFQGESEALEALDIPFLLLGPPSTLEGAFAQLLVVGAATGHLGESSRLAENLVAGVAELTDAAAPIRGITIYHEVDDLLYSASSESFIGDLYRRLGLINIADGVEGGGAFPQLTAEFILAEDPEFIFLGDAGFGVTIDTIEARPGWNTIRAVVDGNVVELDGDVAGRWGPRTIELMATVYRAVESAVR